MSGIVVSLKRRLHVLLEEHPGIARLVRRVHTPLFWLWKVKVRLQSQRATGGLVDPHRTLFVNPADIVYAINWTARKGFNRYADRGKVISGDWDLDVMPFNDKDLYKSFESHFKEGTPWEETEYYRMFLEDVQKGSYRRGMKSEADLQRWVEGVDSLYESIKTLGYRSIQELSGGKHATVGNEDEVCVRIGRDGDLLFEDGRHRLAIATLLNIPTIPVKVIARHTQWMAFIKEIHAYANENSGRVYSVIPHPDLSDIPAMHGWERLEMIKPHLPEPPGHVLDIGCHWGFFCVELEKVGFQCTGVEINERYQYFLGKIRRACRCEFEVARTSIFEYEGASQCDVVIALYIFHHFLKSESSYQQLVKFLRSLDIKVMIFGSHNTDQEAMQQAYRNFDEDAFVDFILANSCLNHATRLGSEGEGRAIYCLKA